MQSIQLKNTQQHFIANLAESKIAFLKIKEIRKVKPSNGEVFDVEIPQTNMFVGGIGPILLHNTGGGIIFASMAGKAAAETIYEHIAYNKPLSNYNRKTEPICKELELHWKIHNYFTGQTDSQINSLFGKLKKARVEQFLSDHGNMDFPSSFVPKLLSNPRMLL